MAQITKNRIRRVFTLRPERFASVDAGIYVHVTRRNLAKLAEEQGDRAEAVRQWSAVRAEVPGDAEAIGALRRLGHQPAEAVGRTRLPSSLRDSN